MASTTGDVVMTAFSRGAAFGLVAGVVLAIGVMLLVMPEVPA